MVQNIIIDLHNGGPIIYNKKLLMSALSKKKNNLPINQIIREINKERANLLIEGLYPEYENAWLVSGVNLAIRTVGIFTDPPFSIDVIVADVALVNQITKHVNWLELIKDKNSFRQIFDEDKKGYLLMIESLEGFQPKEDLLDKLQQMDIKIVQPVYNYGNWFGGGCFDKVDGGLTDKGGLILNSLRKGKICIDHSHLGETTSFDIFRKYYPFNIATHTFSSSISPHRRGKSDFFFRRLAETNGFAALTVNPNFLCNKNLKIEDVFIRQVAHLLDIMGENKIGIGTDWDGPMPNFLVDGLNDAASKLQHNNYQLDRPSNFYNGMFDWGNIIDVLIHEFGQQLTQRLIGKNAFDFLLSIL